MNLTSNGGVLPKYHDPALITVALFSFLLSPCLASTFAGQAGSTLDGDTIEVLHGTSVSFSFHSYLS